MCTLRFLCNDQYASAGHHTLTIEDLSINMGCSLCGWRPPVPEHQSTSIGNQITVTAICCQSVV
jgi:hypothetical protein